MIKKSFLCCVLFLLSCQSPHLTHLQGIAMTIPYHVQIGQRLNKKEEACVKQIVETTFLEIHMLYNHWNPDSEISQLNQCALFTQISLSEKLLSFLHLAKEISLQTEGYFDPTAGKVIRMWKEALRSHRIPSTEETLLPLGWNHLELQSGAILKTADIEIDLDGISKGYAVDLAAERLYEAGFKNCYVEWGGEIRVSGHHPLGRPWQVLISAKQERVPLCDQAIATSGDDQQFWEIEKKTYFHIIHPFTKHALEVDSIASVTVIAPSCTLADALATRGMLFSNREEALAWASLIEATYPEISFFFTFHSDGQPLSTY